MVEFETCQAGLGMFSYVIFLPTRWTFKQNRNFTLRLLHKLGQSKYECAMVQELADAAAYVMCRADAAYALTRWQRFSAWNDIMAAILNGSSRKGGNSQVPKLNRPPKSNNVNVHNRYDALSDMEDDDYGSDPYIS